MLDGRARPPAAQQRGAEIVEPFDIVRVFREEQLEVLDRARVISEHRVGVSEMLMDLLLVGAKLLNALELGFRQSELTAIREEDAEIAMTDRAGRIRLERVPPECLGVAPDLNLL